MARKHQHAHVDSNEGHEGEAQTNAAPVALIIAGNGFHVTPPYAEGHTLTAAEAAVMNQTWKENLRNNFAKQVKAALGEGESLLPESTRGELQEKLDEYAAGYSFEQKGTRVGRPRVVDPVEREARRLAQNVVNAALNARGLAKKDLADGLYDQLVEKVLKDRPEIREQARSNVETRQAVANDALAGMELVTKPQDKPTEAAEAAE